MLMLPCLHRYVASRKTVMRFAVLLAALLGLSGCTGAGAALINVATGESGLHVERGIAYGAKENQAYDLYEPADGTADALVIFYHGGGWRSGSRSMYKFVGASLAKQGFAVAIPGYRLYPQVTFPAFVEDAALAFSVIHQREAKGRPVFVMGHSAGAHIGGLITFDERYLGRYGLDACEAVSGFVGLSGPYDLEINAKRKPIFPPKRGTGAR